MTLETVGKKPPYVITFERFVEAYDLPPFTWMASERLREAADDPHRFEDPTGVGFATRTRVPNGEGFFGLEAEGAQWCDPKDWLRLYYLARKAASPPGCFPDSP